MKMTAQGSFDTESLVPKAHKDVIIKLLENYKEQNCLWDTESPQYTNRDIRYESYKILLEIYKKLDPTATMYVLKRKLENLRAAYKREARKVRLHNYSYRPKLWYYDYLTFLNDTNEVNRNGSDTFAEDEDSCMKTEPEVQIEQSPSVNLADLHRPPPKRNRREYQEQQPVDQGPYYQPVQTGHYPQASLDLQDDDFEAIGRGIGAQLKHLSRSQRIVACKLISDVVFYGGLNRLTESSSIKLYHEQHQECPLTFPRPGKRSPPSTPPQSPQPHSPPYC